MKKIKGSVRPTDKHADRHRHKHADRHADGIYAFLRNATVTINGTADHVIHGNIIWNASTCDVTYIVCVVNHGKRRPGDTTYIM